MARRRFGPLVVSVVLATLVLLLRLGQVQLGPEAVVWADEARSLVRFGHVLPYRRGDLLDREGRVLAQDVETYHVVFMQREFRRGHPLGQVAHALSAIEKRCVPLTEAWARMDDLALALVELSPDELEAFGRGAALEHGPLQAPAVPAGAHEEDERRWSRRGDIAFYVVRLLGLSQRESGDLSKLVREQSRLGGEPYVELASRALGRRKTADQLRTELRSRLAAARDDLEDMARLLAAAEEAGGATTGPTNPTLRLLERLDGWRAQVEDGAASDLFEDACGFWPGRVRPDTLLAQMDLEWVRALLHWDAARVEQWLEHERAWWLRYQGIEGELGGTYRLQELVIEAELAPEGLDRLQLVRERWTEPFLVPPQAVPEPSLFELMTGVEPGPPRRLTVFQALDDLFETRPAADERPSRAQRFAFQDPAWVEAGASDACEVLARVELWFPGASAGDLEQLEPAVQARAEEWRAWRADYERMRIGRMKEDLIHWTQARWKAWERDFQERLAGELAGFPRESGARLRLAEGRLDRAVERVRFALRDHGGRGALVAERPGYELVHLLTRRPWSFEGFVVERAHERVPGRFEPPAGGEPRPPLVTPLLGRVRTPRLRDLYQRRDSLERFQLLRQKGQRTPQEQQTLERLVQDLRRSDETFGSGGLEALLEPDLAGRNGYVEELGLQEELESAGRTTDVAPIDGLPARLTIDVDLQLAAADVLEHPRRPPVDEDKLDPRWLGRPTGAIVLMDVSGEVLVAASFPDRERGSGVDIGDQPLERTLRLFDTQPPGSVMKPFVAAWALDKLHLDPNAAIECSRAAHPVTGRAGYKTVHCSLVDGHGEHVDLLEGLRRSCNSYFAWVGDTCYEPAAFLEMYAAFGFGRPTGVRELGGARHGLVEDGDETRYQPSRESLAANRNLMLACNGLGAPQTTVMQVARAYAGLATGRLPEVRLVSEARGQPIEARATELPLRPASLQRVRSALDHCANDLAWPAGSAAKALAQDELDMGSLRLAAKTGSADLRRATEDGDGRVLKHTWLASWFPSDEPRYVLVVFCYQTYATSSASSIWVARQFLQHPTVRAWLREEGLAP